MSDYDRKKSFEKKLKSYSAHPYADGSSDETTSDGDPTKGERIREKATEVEIESNNHYQGLFYQLLIKDKRYLEKVMNSEAMIYKLNPPNIDFKYMELNKKGYYSPEKNCIIINENAGVFKDFMDAVKTVIHEMRHYYQFDVMSNTSVHPEAPSSIRNYIVSARESYKKDKEKFELYWHNGLEVDARSFSNARIDDYNGIDFSTLTGIPLKVHYGNQILREPNTVDFQGQLSPINVGASFEKNLNPITNNNRKENIMGIRNTTDISEEAQREALKFYAHIIQRIQQETEKTAKSLSEHVKSRPYLQTQNAANVFINYYNTELPAGIQSAIKSWKETDASIAGFVKNIGGGDAAISKARRLEDGILDDVISNFKSLDELNIDVSGINTNTDAIKESADMVCAVYKQMQSYESEVKSKINSLIDSNTIYKSIEIVVLDTFKYVIASLKGTVDSLTNVSEEYNTDVTQNLNNAGGKVTNGPSGDISAQFISARRRRIH